ncbi:MAG: ABC transporter permease [Verrucomicrobia bacterium]|nr:ABC transporter permease [Verrucomicrobiota bacterium]
MTRYFVSRLLFMFPVLLAITFLNFALYSIAPGDPVTMMMNPLLGASGTGQRMTIERVRAMVDVQRELRGLNRPLPERYWLWLGELLQGNLGLSMITSRPVVQIIGQYAWPTIQLNLIGITLSTALGIGLGVAQATNKYSAFDHAAAGFSFFYLSMPGFFLALLLIYLFALVLGWLPTGGYSTIGEVPNLSDRLWHLILPATTLSLGGLPFVMRITRTAMLEIMGQNYISCARARGLSERVVVLKHALRNCLIPVITLVGGMVMWLFSGSIIVESVFTWPGLGLLFIRVVGERDYPVIMGLVLITSLLSVTVILLTDIAYTIVDPRVRLER